MRKDVNPPMVRSDIQVELPQGDTGLLHLGMEVTWLAVRTMRYSYTGREIGVLTKLTLDIVETADLLGVGALKRADVLVELCVPGQSVTVIVPSDQLQRV